MKEIYYKNEIVYKDELPEGTIGFQYRLYVDRFNSFFASKEGDKLFNCTVDGNVATIRIQDQHLGIGELMVEKTYIFINGKASTKVSTGYKIVGELTPSTAHAGEKGFIDLDNVDIEDDGEYLKLK